METQVLSKTVIIEGSNNRPMGVDVYGDFRDGNSKPVVIFCHGYKGFKDWGCWSLVAEEFVSQGFNFIKFNFSHNGVTLKNLIEFDDLEAFGNNNYTKELFDLSKIINWCCNEFDIPQIYLIGHSRGGGIASLAAAKDDRIKKCITWASVSSLIDRIPNNIDKWREEGVVYQLNGRTKQNMPLFFQLYENTKANLDSLDIKKLVRKINIPFCIIHGSEDLAVSIEDAENLDDWIPKSKLILIEGATHTFGSYHPYDKKILPKDLKKVVNESIKFFQ